jgi:uncharacterized membrane protein YsdA (DUF1294 family)
MIAFISFSAYLLLSSLVTFILYVTDKNKAKKGKWRLKESNLLLSSFIGGAIGGYLAMFTVRHKTSKWYFHFVNLVGVFWQTAFWLYLLFMI